MQTHRLVPHPSFAPGKIQGVVVRWSRVAGERVMLRFRVDGCQTLKLPNPKQPVRADDLWKTTCFELFLAGQGGAYREYNFSPSGEWAAYSFSGYRTRVGNHVPAAPPAIGTDQGQSVYTFTVFLPAAELENCDHAAMTAVLEEERGRMSYWAPRHPTLRPDFHEPSCFVLPVP